MVTLIEQCLAEARVLKARDRPGPPGPPPAWNPDLIWKPESSRWVLPEDVESGPMDAMSPRISVISMLRRGEMTLTQIERGMADRFYEAQRTPRQGVIIPEEEIWDSWALSAYVEDSEGINDLLRRPDEMRDEKLQRYIDQIVAMMRPMGKPRRLFRGQVDVRYDDLKVGEGLMLDGFTSASRVPSTAVLFTYDQHSALLELDVSPAVSGLHLLNDHDETILKPGALVQVQSIGDVEGRQVIRGRIDA